MEISQQECDSQDKIQNIVFLKERNKKLEQLIISTAESSALNNHSQIKDIITRFNQTQKNIQQKDNQSGLIKRYLQSSKVFKQQQGAIQSNNNLLQQSIQSPNQMNIVKRENLTQDQVQKQIALDFQWVIQFKKDYSVDLVIKEQIQQLISMIITVYKKRLCEKNQQFLIYGLLRDFREKYKINDQQIYQNALDNQNESTSIIRQNPVKQLNSIIMTGGCLNLPKNNYQNYLEKKVIQDMRIQEPSEFTQHQKIYRSISFKKINQEIKNKAMLVQENEQQSSSESCKILKTIEEVFMSQFSDFEQKDLTISIDNSISSSESENEDSMGRNSSNLQSLAEQIRIMKSSKNLEFENQRKISVTRKVTFGPRALMGLKESFKLTVTDQQSNSTISSRDIAKKKAQLDSVKEQPKEQFQESSSFSVQSKKRNSNLFSDKKSSNQNDIKFSVESNEIVIGQYWGKNKDSDESQNKIVSSIQESNNVGSLSSYQQNSLPSDMPTKIKNRPSQFTRQQLQNSESDLISSEDRKSDDKMKINENIQSQKPLLRDNYQINNTEKIKRRNTKSQNDLKGQNYQSEHQPQDKLLAQQTQEQNENRSIEPANSLQIVEKQNKIQSCMNLNFQFQRSKTLCKQLSRESKKPADDTRIGQNKVKRKPQKRESSVVSSTNIVKLKSKTQGTMINNYLIEKNLGEGSFAQVKLCRDKNSDVQYAIKLMNKKELKRKINPNGRSAYECVLEEIKVLQKLEHPNIIWLHEIIDDPLKDDYIYLVTEYHSKGSLGDQIKKLNSKFNEHNQICKKQGKYEDMRSIGLSVNIARFYFIDMLKALHYCHNVVKVYHRDIKPDNIMINHNNEAVLIDFGVSTLMEEQKNENELKNNMQGSYQFFAPELLSRKNDPIRQHIKGETSDIWALGISFYFILTGKTPYHDAKNVCQLSELVHGREIDFGLIKDPEAREVLEKMLEKDPLKRASLEDLTKLKWCSFNNNEKLEVDNIEENEVKGLGNVNRTVAISNLKKSYSFKINFESKFNKKNID